MISKYVQNYVNRIFTNVIESTHEIEPDEIFWHVWGAFKGQLKTCINQRGYRIVLYSPRKNKDKWIVKFFSTKEKLSVDYSAIDKFIGSIAWGTSVDKKKYAALPAAFWPYWKDNKKDLQRAGLTVSKESNQWQLNLI